jgi:hypothetical protein
LVVPKADFTVEQLDNLRHITDVVIAGWLVGSANGERR